MRTHTFVFEWRNFDAQSQGDGSDVSSMLPRIEETDTDRVHIRGQCKDIFRSRHSWLRKRGSVHATARYEFGSEREAKSILGCQQDHEATETAWRSDT